MAEKRRFELIEGASKKFWEISSQGTSYTVTFGRIGSAGTAKTTTCATPAAAQAEVDKLVREKTKKGYQEVGAAQAKPAWRPPEHYGTHQHVKRFMNYAVAGFRPAAEAGEESEDESGRKDYPSLRNLDRLVFRIGLQYDDDEDTFDERLDALLDDPKVGDLRGLVVGNWWADAGSQPPFNLIAKLIERAGSLKSLEGLFVGDVVQEESELSWIEQGDFGPLLNALPQLRVFVVRGGQNLRFTKLAHEGLRSLTVQTGGLSVAALNDISSAKLPALKDLTLWLGVPHYGGDSRVADLKKILAGKGLPALEHLGLQNSEQQDAIAAAVAKSAILERLQGLDLSMGTLTDEGAKALLASAAVRNLRHLNIRHHYVSASVVAQLKALGIEVNATDRQPEDGEHRYAEVTE
jgi:predicted DNA-binding WGR domain protein